ncbi:MAG: RlmE family RNA methyltransferase [Alphaproteobacteria bacterium]|nr:RlmE family RNA methyltransferase [Rickettsiales bacterium]
MQYHLIIKSTKSKKNKSGQTDMHKIQSSHKAKITKVANKKLKESSKKWVKRHINDPFVQQARIDNFISRAAYKIIEINDKYKLFSKPMNVVEIGAAPGSWSQIIWDKIENVKSKLISIDLLEMIFQPQKGQKNIHQIQGDFTSKNVQQKVLNLSNGKINLILSDMAPNTIGCGIADQLAIEELSQQVIEFAKKHLSVNGSLVYKVLEGDGVRLALPDLRKNFKLVKPFKPTASRKNSKELYIVAINYKNKK